MSKIKLLIALAIAWALFAHFNQASAGELYQIKSYDVKIEFRGTLEGNEKTEYTYTIRQVTPSVNNPKSVKIQGTNSHDVTIKMVVLHKNGVSPQFEVRLAGKSKRSKGWKIWESAKPIKTQKFNTLGGVDTQKIGNFTLSFREAK